MDVWTDGWVGTMVLVTAHLGCVARAAAGEGPPLLRHGRLQHAVPPLDGAVNEALVPGVFGSAELACDQANNGQATIAKPNAVAMQGRECKCGWGRDARYGWARGYIARTMALLIARRRAVV